MRRGFDFWVFLSGIVAGAALGVTLSHLGWLPSLRRAPAERIRELSNAEPGAQPAHTRGGAATAAVTLEEFGDYQCPPCGALHPGLKKIESEYGARVRFVFRHYPLVSIHKRALQAARAAEAAALQDRFWEMHDRLYETQDEWVEDCDARGRFIAYARELGMDTSRFARDMDSPEMIGRVLLDQRRGDSAGVDATPTLFLNGREIPSSRRTPEGIRASIEAALKSQ